MDDDKAAEQGGEIAVVARPLAAWRAARRTSYVLAAFSFLFMSMFVAGVRGDPDIRDGKWGYFAASIASLAGVALSARQARRQRSFAVAQHGEALLAEEPTWKRKARRYRAPLALTWIGLFSVGAASAAPGDTIYLPTPVLILCIFGVLGTFCLFSVQGPSSMAELTEKVTRARIEVAPISGELAAALATELAKLEDVSSETERRRRLAQAILRDPAVGPAFTDVLKEALRERERSNLRLQWLLLILSFLLGLIGNWIAAPILGVLGSIFSG